MRQNKETQSEELKNIFRKANDNFIRKNKLLFETKVAERTLCGALMLELHEELKDTKYNKYYVDVEYNRNRGQIKTMKKTIKGPAEKIVTINCDLIVHSRGNCPSQDNLIAIEMKKSNTKLVYKDNDRSRLEALTKMPYDDVWSYGGEALPEYVCGYALGIYYEINYKRKEILLEYYNEGYKVNSEIIEMYPEGERDSE